MTDKTPTDARQYLNVASQCAATATSELTTNVLVDGGSGTLRELLNDAADAIRAGWGQPAQAGEPFGYFHQLLNHEGKGNGVWLGAAERKVVEQAHTPGETSEEIVTLYTTPQPTHAQAGAVPLTCEWTHNEDDGFWETACGEAWRFDDGGPGENNMHFCHSCGKSLRIKGGQHGTE